MKHLLSSFVKNFGLLAVSLCLSVFFIPTASSKTVLNVFTWGGLIPSSLIRKFESETGIDVQVSTYDSNEALFAKLKVTHEYDVIMPSTYFIQKLTKLNLLETIDQQQLPNIQHLKQRFKTEEFKATNTYGAPFSWYTTGIFYNQKYYKNPIDHWHLLWQPIYQNKLLLLDDPRELFSAALIKLGYSPNDGSPKALADAYNCLLSLQANIRLMITNAIRGLIIDEDFKVGMIWNSDMLKVQQENNNIKFVLPSEGYPMSVDCLSILKDAKHKKAAYQFINFLFDPQNSAKVMEIEGVSTTNADAAKFLPDNLRLNPILNPSDRTLAHGILIKDWGENATNNMMSYWLKFKLSF